MEQSVRLQCLLYLLLVNLSLNTSCCCSSVHNSVLDVNVVWPSMFAFDAIYLMIKAAKRKYFIVKCVGFVGMSIRVEYVSCTLQIE